MAHPNLQLLIEASRLLIPILDEVVFVGGCTTGLFISDQGAGELRTTLDVDAIAEITSYADYSLFSARLRKLDFTEDTSEGDEIRHSSELPDSSPRVQLLPLFVLKFGRSPQRSITRKAPQKMSFIAN